MMTVFVGLILFMIVVFMIVNGSFLEKYYISNKKSDLRHRKKTWEDLQRKIIFPLQSSIQNTMWFILM